jgi:hypothetical protein
MRTKVTSERPAGGLSLLSAGHSYTASASCCRRFYLLSHWSSRLGRCALSSSCECFLPTTGHFYTPSSSCCREFSLLSPSSSWLYECVLNSSCECSVESNLQRLTHTYLEPNAPFSILRRSYDHSTMVSIDLRMHWLHAYPSSAVAVPPNNDCRFLLLMPSDSSALFGLSSIGCFQSPTGDTLGGLHAIPHTVLAGPIVVGTSLPSL